MNIGLLAPSVYMSKTVYDDMIFAPRDLVISLADGLKEKGHDVYLFSSPDTKTNATLVSGNMGLIQNEYGMEKLDHYPGERAKWASFYGKKRNYEADLTARCFAMARKGELDIIHSYTDELAHFFEESSGIPTVYTLHDPLPSKKKDLSYWVLRMFSHQAYVSISNASRIHPTLALSYVATVYHGIDLSLYKQGTGEGGYVLFMGRLVLEKGLHDAIQCAIEGNHTLQIGTDFPDEIYESPYYRDFIKPYLDRPGIEELGMVLGDKKHTVYQQAKALLFPIHWEEPFGMVMIEAMACGTPVIAYNQGSVPEVIVDGVTGFIIDPPEGDETPYEIGKQTIKKRGVDGLTEALNRINEIDRNVCRKHVEDHFSVETMVKGYENVYERVMSKDKG